MFDPRDEITKDLPQLEYEIKHNVYCSERDNTPDLCKCGEDQNLCDSWQLHFDSFVIEIWNEYPLLDHELRDGSNPDYMVSDINFTLKSDVKEDTWICTLSFEDGKRYLKIHNKQ